MIRSSKKARQRRSVFLKLDALARQRCFERDHHHCVRCSNNRTIQWSHVIGRRHPCTRWELDNSLTLCAGCHRFWHEYPTLSGEWFRKNWPDRHEHILKLFNAGGKVDLDAKFEELSEPLPPHTAFPYRPIEDDSTPF